MFTKVKKRSDRAMLDNDLTVVDSHTCNTFGVAVPDQRIQRCAGPATLSARSSRKSKAPKHSRTTNLTTESLERRVQSWGVWRADSDTCTCLFGSGGQTTNSLSDEAQPQRDMSNYFFDQLLSPSNGASAFHHGMKAKSKRNRHADQPRRPSLILALSFEGDGPRRPSMIDERPMLGDGFENFEQLEPHIRTAASQLIIPLDKGQSLRVLQVDF